MIQNSATELCRLFGGEADVRLWENVRCAVTSRDVYKDKPTTLHRVNVTIVKIMRAETHVFHAITLTVLDGMLPKQFTASTIKLHMSDRTITFEADVRWITRLILFKTNTMIFPADVFPTTSKPYDVSYLIEPEDKIDMKYVPDDGAIDCIHELIERHNVGVDVMTSSADTLVHHSVFKPAIIKGNHGLVTYTVIVSAKPRSNDVLIGVEAGNGRTISLYDLLQLTDHLITEEEAYIDILNELCDKTQYETAWHSSGLYDRLMYKVKVIKQRLGPGYRASMAAKVAHESGCQISMMPLNM